MKICIIGASGKLGKYIVQHALDRGYEVAGVCRERSVMICSCRVTTQNEGGKNKCYCVH